jgi:glucokinase
MLADIGGTNARFAIFEDGRVGEVGHFVVADHAGIEAVVTAYLAGHTQRPPEYAVLGVAGPVENRRCEITNSHWHVDAESLSSKFGFLHVHLLNDFEATAWALESLSPADLRPIGAGTAVPGAPKVVLGPGTGLGIAALVPYAGSSIVIPTEGGHADLPGNSVREDAVIDHLRRTFGHASAERALSGSGLENLYRAITSLDRTEAPPRRASGITDAAARGTCATSRATLDMFCAMLGAVAGDLALIFRARGGVYIAGGIAPRISDYLARSEFRSRFVAKGRFRAYAESIPTSIIMHPDPAFMGLKCVAERMLTGELGTAMS